MQGSIAVVKTVKTKMRDYRDDDKKRDRDTFKKHRKNAQLRDKRKFSFADDEDWLALVSEQFPKL